MQEEIEYFGGPADGSRVAFKQPIFARYIIGSYEPPFSSWQIIAVGGYYQPEQQPNGIWRLHFFDTVQR